MSLPLCLPQKRSNEPKKDNFPNVLRSEKKSELNEEFYRSFSWKKKYSKCYFFRSKALSQPYFLPTWRSSKMFEKTENNNKHLEVANVFEDHQIRVNVFRIGTGYNLMSDVDPSLCAQWLRNHSCFSFLKNFVHWLSIKHGYLCAFCCWAGDELILFISFFHQPMLPPLLM